MFSDGNFERGGGGRGSVLVCVGQIVNNGLGWLELSERND